MVEDAHWIETFWVTDWGYLNHDRQVGNIIICALFKDMPAEQADHYRKHHRLDH